MQINLKPNIGGIDREARLVGGTLLTLAGCLTKNKVIKTVGCIVLFTGITRKCVFYDLLGINTSKNS